MIILGIDYGRKRIGIAIADSQTRIAIPEMVFDYSSLEECLIMIENVMHERTVHEVVVGQPRSLKGESGKSGEEVKEFARLLRERLGVSVHLWDERLTTKQAERIMMRAGVSRRKWKKIVDAISAQIMLQSYLDAATKLTQQDSQ